MAPISSKPLSTTVNTEEVNYLVFRYLQESGYIHTAFTFAYESHVASSKIDASQIPAGALLSFLQRGVNFVEIEEDLKDPEAEATTTTEQFPSLLDVHRALCIGSSRRVKLETRPNSNSNGETIDNSSIHEPAAAHGEGPEKSAPMDIESTPNPAQDEPATPVANDQSETRLQINSSDVLMLKGHRSEVFVCAWNPRTSVLASGSGDSTCRIWDVPSFLKNASPFSSATVSQPTVLHHKSVLADGEQAFSPSKRTNDVTTIDWNTDGTLLATGSYDGCARIWDEYGDLKFTLSLHKGPLFSLKWNRSGSYLLSGSVDKTTAVWETTTGRCVKHFMFHQAPTLDVDWKDDTSFASCSTDKSIYLCSVQDSGPLRVYEGHRDEINCIRFDSSGSLLASCSDDHTAKIWSVSSSNPVYDLREHTKEVYTLRWSPSTFRRLLLATASFDTTLKLWDINTGRCMQTLRHHTDPVYSLDFSPNGDYLVSGSFDRSICIWSVKDGKLLKTYTGPGGIFEATWSPDGDKVAASFSNNTVAVIDCRKM